MKTFPKVSLCISTYNWPAALELCVESVMHQTHLPDEVIIGDDGSTNETGELVERLKAKLGIPLVHVWQPDEGFKLAQIRNKSFAAARGSYIIQIDGDVILNKYFIEDHLRFAAHNVFLCGARSLLTATSSKLVFDKREVARAGMDYPLEKRYNAWRALPVAWMNYQVQKGVKQARFVLGANMSFWKEDLIKVNGYNEDFKGWGKEDNDLSIRLCNAGVELRFLKFAGVIYHLYHKEAPRDTMHENELLLMSAMEQKQTFVANGLSKYLK